MWVPLSEFVDHRLLLETIMQEIDANVTKSELGDLALRNLRDKVVDAMAGKTSLLVLDGVTHLDDADCRLIRKLFERSAEGSVILITARQRKVAWKMDAFAVCNVPPLDDESCWKIFEQLAFHGLEVETTENMINVGRELSRRSHGFPLLAKTLGSLMNNNIWGNMSYQQILTDEIWGWDTVKADVFNPLLMCYYALPPAVRRCFMYCSVFPQDVVIEKDDLIQQWMAQGYLIPERRGHSRETIGLRYFKTLVDLSFFQYCEVVDGTLHSCKMQAVMVDFARYLMHDEFVLNNVKREEDSGLYNSSEAAPRHVLFVMEKDSDFPSYFPNPEKLRSMTFFKVDDASGFGTEDENWVELNDAFCGAVYLRSLSFLGCNIRRLPEAVGHMVHLRLLNLSHSGLRELPESVCDLCQLQTLNLDSCHLLRSLPTKMERLIKLMVLNTRDCYSLHFYPKSVGDLISLRKVIGIPVKCDGNDDDKFTLGDFQYLSHLSHLTVVLRGKHLDARQAVRGNFESKSYLQELTLVTGDLENQQEDHIKEVLGPLPPLCKVKFDRANRTARGVGSIVFAHVFGQRLRGAGASQHSSAASRHSSAASLEYDAASSAT